jgi:hypothetical protein
VWGCLEEPLPNQGIVADLERRVAAAVAALAALDRCLAHTAAGSLEGVLAARTTLRAATSTFDGRALRDVAVAVEHLVAELRAFEAGLALVRRLRDAPPA